ncbi:MAG: metalloregulator ArsR/SmtB family transcription factor [Coriobacteriia bacterium]|nr:metalloregulator ArsR/SmtB family transcription factor [Coriobacteriia bacterium]
MTVAADRLTEKQLDAALKALASAQRREIVRFLIVRSSDAEKSCCAADEVCACKLSEHLGLAASTISHHMAALRDAGLVTARRDGTWVYYTVQRGVLAAVATAIEGL